MKSGYDVLIGNEVYTVVNGKIYTGKIVSTGRMKLYENGIAKGRVNYIRVEWQKEEDSDILIKVRDYQIGEIGSKVFFKREDAEKLTDK